MGTSAAAGAVRLPHLLPCPDCGADNGVTARVCWSCEGPLLRKHLRPSDFELQQPAAAEPAAEPTVPVPAPSLASDPELPPEPEPQLQADPEPSFFPILHDEAAGFQTAANDQPGDELAARFMRRRNSAWRVRIGVVCGASAVMVLGTYLIASGVTKSHEAQVLALVSSTAPAPNATLAPTPNVVSAAVRPAIEPVAAAPLPAPLPKIEAPRHGDVQTVRAAPKLAADQPVKAKRRAVTPPPADAPAPADPASCAPQVVALGLCGASSR